MKNEIFEFLRQFSAVDTSVAELGAGAAGAATFRAALEPELIFLLVGAGSWSRTF